MSGVDSSERFDSARMRHCASDVSEARLVVISKMNERHFSSERDGKGLRAQFLVQRWICRGLYVSLGSLGTCQRGANMMVSKPLRY